MAAPSVLLLAPDDGATNQWVIRALARAGCDGVNLDYREVSQTHGLDGLQQVVLDAAKDYDLVLGLKAETIHPQTWGRLRQAGKHTAIWMPDCWFQREPWVLEAARSVDAYFTPGYGLIAGLRANGVNAHWLPEGCDVDDHAPLTPMAGEPIMPVTFVGTIEGIPQREVLLLQLREELGSALRVFGSNPGRLTGPYHYGRAEEYCGQGNRSLSWVANRSLITLDHQRNPEIQRTYGARIWRTLCSGSALLTNHIIGIEQDFGPNGTSLAWYTDAEDCLRWIENLLTDRAKRAKMAEEGRRLVLNHHTFDHRVRELLTKTGLPADRPISNGLIGRGM